MPLPVRLVLLSLFPLGAGLLSIQRGKSAGYDWMLYHHYNAYAFLNGRESADILPAGVRGFWNPLVELPFYACITALPAQGCAFAAGFVHGLNYALVVPIAALALRPFGHSPRLAGVLPWLLALAGALGAGSFGMLGGANHDNLVSLFFLMALLLLMRAADQRGDGHGAGAAWVLLAGVSVGIGCGLKLTLASFGVAIVLGPLFLVAPWRCRLAMLVACGFGAAIGGLASSGFLMLRMARLTANPLFPYFTRLFGGPYRDFVDARDLRYLPGSLAEAAFYPFVFVADPRRVSEFLFRDYRLPALLALVLAVAAAALWRRLPATPSWLAARPAPLVPPARMLLGVLAVGYLGWMAQASVYRYVFPIEILSFVAMAILLGRIFGPRGRIVALAGLALAIIPTTSPFATRRLPWDGPNFLSVALPAAPVPAHGAVVLMAGSSALSYVLPSFPPDIRFLGIDTISRLDIFATGESGGFNIPAQETELGPFGPAMRTIIAAHRGQILGLFNTSEEPRARSAFARYGLALDPARCGTIRTNVATGNPPMLCELRAPLP